MTLVARPFCLPRTAKHDARRAFISFSELLLLLAILAVLALLLIPAVHKARAAVQRAACQNNLRQLGTALLAFHDQNGVFPASGGYRGEAAYLVELSPTEGPCGGGCRWGVGHPGRGPEDQPGSWAYSLWPFLDPAAAAGAGAGPHAGAGVALPVLLCPGRGRSSLQAVAASDPVYAGLRYASHPAAAGPWGKSDFAGNGLVLPQRGAALLRIASIGNGLSHTVLMGEKALDPQAYESGGWHWDAPVFAGGPAHSRTGTRVLRDQIDPERSPAGAFANAWGSPHAGGAHFLFADGSVRVLRHGVSGPALLRLLSPGGCSARAGTLLCQQ
jgi:prepilin-type processing-associated H-X9-DG protein